MPRGHVGDRRRSSKVLASPIPGHLSSYPITTPRFFFHASHEFPSHDHIHSSTPIGFGGHLAPCAFIFSHLVCLVFSTNHPLALTSFYIHAHPPPTYLFCRVFRFRARFGTSGFLAQVLARYCAVPILQRVACTYCP